MTYATHFPIPLRLELLPPTILSGRRKFRTCVMFEYVRPNREVVEVPIGTVVDGASIPVFFYRAIGPPWGNYAEASVVHDYLWGEAAQKRGTYKHANKVFLEAMKALGVSCWLRRLMWLAVTLNVWWRWLR